jgi:DNA-binding ferritin-like protein
MDDDELSAVWRDPMEYDMQKHGPPYLPATASQRVEAREFAQKRAAYYDVPTPDVDQYGPLSVLLALLRAAYMVHQTAHWQTRGSHYYGDHTMLQRIYEESLPGIDGVAERVIGLGNTDHVDPVKQAQLVQGFVSAVCQGPSSPDAEALISRSLDIESVVLKAVDQVKAAIDSSGGLTEGLDDLLQGTASKHEEFVYLLKQRVEPGAAARFASDSYDRR